MGAGRSVDSNLCHMCGVRAGRRRRSRIWRACSRANGKRNEGSENTKLRSSVQLLLVGFELRARAGKNAASDRLPDDHTVLCYEHPTTSVESSYRIPLEVAHL